MQIGVGMILCVIGYLCGCAGGLALGYFLGFAKAFGCIYILLAILWPLVMVMAVFASIVCIGRAMLDDVLGG